MHIPNFSQQSRWEVTETCFFLCIVLLFLYPKIEMRALVCFILYSPLMKLSRLHTEKKYYSNG